MATSSAVYQDGQPTKATKISVDAATGGGIGWPTWAENISAPQNLADGASVLLNWASTPTGGGAIVAANFSVVEPGWYRTVCTCRVFPTGATTTGTLRCTAHFSDGGTVTGAVIGDSGPQPIVVGEFNAVTAVMSQQLVPPLSVAFRLTQTNDGGATQVVDDAQFTVTRLS